MAANFNRIHRELDKLNPSFPEALNKAVVRMKESELLEGGDDHHGLPRAVFPQFDFRKNLKSEWNRVRLRRLVHIEYHILLAAAFVNTKWFEKFAAAHILNSAKIHVSPLQDRKEEVIRLRDAGHIMGKAAIKLGVSRHILVSFCRKRKIKWHRWGKLHGRKKEVIKLRDTGITAREAAKKLGVSLPVLVGFCVKEHIKWPRGKLHGRKKEVIKLRDVGNTRQEAAKKLGVPYSTLFGFCARKGIKWII